ncbi:MAG: hypothetical protein WBS54_03045 [Acidobacteriota bacterium]
MWQRAWFRWSVRVPALVLLAALAVVFALRWRGERALRDARREFTQKVGPLNPAAYRPKPMPEEENGAVWLLAGARAVVIFPSERQGLRSLAETSSSHWSPAQVQLAGRLLQRNAPALTLLHRSSTRKACDLSDAVTGKTGYLLPLVAAARLLAADSRDALRQGDMDRFFASAETLRRLASAQECQVELIDLLLGSYAERLLLPVIQEAASAPSLQASDMARLGALLPAVDLAAAMRRTVGYEAAGMMDRIANGTETEHLGIQLGLTRRLALWVGGSADSARALRGWAAWAESMGQPYARRLAPPPAQESASDNPYVFDRQGKTAGRVQATMALRQMTAFGLEVRKAGLERGVYPAELSAFPGAANPDPFTGKPVAYTLHPDGSATLSIPGGDALYDKLSNGKIPTIGATWTLPPLRVERRGTKR